MLRHRETDREDEISLLPLLKHLSARWFKLQVTLKSGSSSFSKIKVPLDGVGLSTGSSFFFSYFLPFHPIKIRPSPSSLHAMTFSKANPITRIHQPKSKECNYQIYPSSGKLFFDCGSALERYLLCQNRSLDQTYRTLVNPLNVLMAKIQMDNRIFLITRQIINSVERLDILKWFN